ncbi:MAG TPA: universal stress protein, partial [Fodinibius sp.]|nr:universal stress protein [Fodinibius sp.]
MPEGDNHKLLLRKILVAVDTSAHSRAALEAAAILASLLEADIRGVFVQEEQWTHLSRLPSLTAIHELTGKAYALQQETLEQEIENVKQRLRRQLKQISSRREITHSLETVQGKAEEEILKAAQEADLITIGWRGRSYPSTKKPGSTARNIIRKADKPVLVLGKNVRLGQRVSVLYDTSSQGQQGLQLALKLAEKNESELSVLVAQPNQKVTGERETSVEK